MINVIAAIKKHTASIVSSSLVGVLVAAFFTQYYAEQNQLKEAQIKYFDGLKSLDLEFRAYMAELGKDNSPPLDSELLQKMTDNLRAQNVQVDMLISSLKPDEVKVFNEYQESLLSTRQVLLASEDPGDIQEIYISAGVLVSKQFEMAEVILQ